MQERDVVIIGAGPAGLSAAIFTKLDGWNTTILEGNWVGGQGAIAYSVVNYPGFPPGDGKMLMEMMEKQTTLPPPAGVGVELRHEMALDIDPDRLIVTTEADSYRAKAIILATGSKMKRLGVSGEERFAGKGVSYYAVRDLEGFAGKKVLVVGGGNSTAKSALIAKTKTDDVLLIHRRDSLRAYPPMVKRLQNEGVRIRYNTQLKAIKGGDRVEGALLIDNKTGAEEEISVDWIVICVGTEPNIELPQKIGLEMDGQFVKVDGRMRTSKDGIFACGELVPSWRHLVNAAAGGASAGMNVSEYLAMEMLKAGKTFEGTKNGRYASEFLEMLDKKIS